MCSPTYFTGRRRFTSATCRSVSGQRSWRRPKFEGALRSVGSLTSQEKAPQATELQAELREINTELWHHEATWWAEVEASKAVNKGVRVVDAWEGSEVLRALRLN